MQAVDVGVEQAGPILEVRGASHVPSPGLSYEVGPGWCLRCRNS